METQKISFEDFSSWSAKDQDEWFLGKFSVEQYDKIGTKKLLRSIVEESNNLFHKREALKLAGLLAVSGGFSRAFILDLCLDLKGDSHPLLLSGSIKILLWFYEYGQTEITNRINELLQHPHPEVMGEASFGLGIITFWDAHKANSLPKFVELCTKAKKFLKQAFDSQENRVDARFFVGTIDLLMAVLAHKKKEVDLRLYELKIHIHQRMLFDELPQFTDFEQVLWNQVNALGNVFYQLDKANKFINVKEEYKILFNNYQLLRTSRLVYLINQQGIFQEMEKFWNREILEKITSRVIKTEKDRLEFLFEQLEPGIFKTFIENLISYSIEQDEDTSISVNLLVKLHLMFPKVPIIQIQDDLGKLKPNDPSGLIDLINRFNKLKLNKSVKFGNDSKPQNMSFKWIGLNPTNQIRFLYEGCISAENQFISPDTNWVQFKQAFSNNQIISSLNIKWIVIAKNGKTAKTSLLHFIALLENLDFIEQTDKTITDARLRKIFLDAEGNPFKRFASSRYSSATVPVQGEKIANLINSIPIS